MSTTSEWIRIMKHNGIETHDATSPIPLKITKWDTKKAVPGNCKHCVVAKKLKQMPGIADAHIFSKIAHVLMFDTKTMKQVNFRFSINKKIRDAIRTFDEGNPFPTGDYVLHPLIRSETREEKGIREKRRAPRTHPSGVKIKDLKKVTGRIPTSSKSKSASQTSTSKPKRYVRKYKDAFVGV